MADARFAQALAYTLLNEGGGAYTDLPLDSGGPTRWGVCLKTLASWRGRPVTADDVKALTYDEAAILYRARYWVRMMCPNVVNQAVATAMFDLSVVCGVTQAAKMTQQGLGVTMDGIIGIVTLRELNARPPQMMVYTLAHVGASYMTSIPLANPSQAYFCLGWLTRIGRLYGLKA